MQCNSTHWKLYDCYLSSSTVLLYCVPIETDVNREHNYLKTLNDMPLVRYEWIYWNDKIPTNSILEQSIKSNSNAIEELLVFAWKSWIKVVVLFICSARQWRFLMHSKQRSTELMNLKIISHFILRWENLIKICLFALFKSVSCSPKLIEIAF